MIKNSTYIRSFTPTQKKQLEQVAQEQGFKNANDVLFFALEQSIEQKKDIARLNRIIEMKQKKQTELQLKADKLETLVLEAKDLINNGINLLIKKL
ncbi:hypothetical protein FLJC2902T_17380 [Flavobacterium limnosediminis JC2902]|uniref:Uncharacterized protein n=1 Tax=Flavobacterium limnosediminis JC2902 TaxID=1341181 RepID=V6SVC9_9FLAO|nr:hypothetical protein [Flavobacterium limnosediminis]ESU28385.1 hypothetical protein FLJC2902T_17380 [Flavobacterium limnosediminis JC2902]